MIIWWSWGWRTQNRTRHETWQPRTQVELEIALVETEEMKGFEGVCVCFRDGMVGPALSTTSIYIQLPKWSSVIRSGELLGWWFAPMGVQVATFQSDPGIHPVFIWETCSRHQQILENIHVQDSPSLYMISMGENAHGHASTMSTLSTECQIKLIRDTLR